CARIGGHYYYGPWFAYW
nr:immunoglobulin heavy chain junction region [Mus musculus]